MNQKEINRLLKMADELTNSGELDLRTEGLTLEEMAAVRAHLSRLRRNIDIVNKALAVAWHEKDPDAAVEISGKLFTVSIGERKEWADEGSLLRFSRWLTKQAPAIVATILPSQPGYGLRLTPVPE